MYLKSHSCTVYVGLAPIKTQIEEDVGVMSKKNTNKDDITTACLNHVFTTLQIERFPHTIKPFHTDMLENQA